MEAEVKVWSCALFKLAQQENGYCYFDNLVGEMNKKRHQ
jgi:hypothetical protein